MTRRVAVRGRRSLPKQSSDNNEIASLPLAKTILKGKVFGQLLVKVS